MSLADQTFIIQTEGEGIIELVAELTTADPATVAMMLEAKAYIDTIDASIGQKYTDVALFNEAITSTEQTFTDSENNERLTWQAMEDFADAANFAVLGATVAGHTTQLSAIDTLHSAQAAQLVTINNANSAQNTRLNVLESTGDINTSQISTINTTLTAQAGLISGVTLVNSQQETVLAGLFSGLAELTPRMLNVEVTYASQNVLIDAQQGITTDHEGRIFELESVTDYDVQIARFTAIEAEDDAQNARLDGIDAGLTTHKHDERYLRADVEAVATENFWVSKASPYVTLNATGGTDAYLQLTQDGVRTGLFYANANELVFRQYDGATPGGTLVLKNTLGEFNVPVVGVDGATSNALMTKGYIDSLNTAQNVDINTRDAQNVKLTGNQSIAGVKTFDTVIIEDATINNATIKSSGELDVGDAVVLLNAGESGTPSVNSGIEVERGTATNARMIWDESADRWAAGLAGAEITLVNSDELQTLSITESQISDFGSYVNLTTAQTIAGIKTFTSDIYSPSIKTDILGINAGTKIATQAILAYTNTARDAAAIGIANDLIHKGYVDAGDALKFDKTGGTLTGDLTIDKASAALIIDADTGTHAQLAFREGGVNRGFIYHDYSNNILRIQHRTTGGTTTNEFQIRETYTLATKSIHVGTSAAGGALLTRDSLDARYLEKTGGTMTNALIIDHTNAEVVLKSDGTGLSRFTLNHDGVRRGMLYGNESTTGLTHYLSDGGTNGAALSLGSSSASLSKSLYIDGDLSVSDTTPMLSLSSTTGNDAILRFHEGGVMTAQMYHDASTNRLRLGLYASNGAAQNELDMRSDVAWFSKSVLTSAGQHGAGNSLTRRDFVEDNFVGLTGNQDIDGIKNFNAAIRADGGLYLDNIAADDNPFIYTNSPFRTSAAAQAAGTNTNDLIWKGYVDANFTSLTGTQTITGNKTYTGTTVFSGSTYCQTPTSDSMVVNKKYITDSFLPLSGGTISGNTWLTKDSPTFELESTGTGAPNLRFRSDGVLSGHIYYTQSADRVDIIKKDTTSRSVAGGGIQNQINIASNSITLGSNTSVSGALTTADKVLLDYNGNSGQIEVSAGLLRLRENSGATFLNVEDDRISTNKQLVVAGDITVQPATGAAELAIASPAGDHAVLWFKENNINSAVMYHDSGNNMLRIQKRNTSDVTQNEFQIREGYTLATKNIHVGTSGAGGALLTRDALDARFVQQTAGYQFVMPTTTPTAGQQLQVGSVSGTTVTMVWV